MKNLEMVAVLQSCSLHSLLMLTSKMLSRSGFGDVQILGRREMRQKSRFGGHELLCEGVVGTEPYRVIVKVINDAVRLRMLDELAGAVIRTKADLGIIVSPHHLTTSADKHQGDYYGARLCVIDGLDMATRLSKLGIGVRPKGSVDYQYFEQLDEVGERALAFMRQEAA